MLKGKVAVVTGASRGIGREVALTLAGYGATVIVNYCGSKEKAEAVVEEITQAGGKAKAYQADVSEFDVAKEMLTSVKKEFGSIDILVNNAGVSDSMMTIDCNPEHFQEIINLNVNAVFNAIQPSVELMKEQGGGCIINTSSMVSKYGQPGGVAYPTSKFGVNGLTISLARELGQYGIRVNAVAPGITRTDMVAALPEEEIQPLIATIPLGRIG
ncbi:SDR family NAD(P)-dependent oxidoreductase, partial [Anaerostipes sp.]|uniref:SDR family NAD(P)-dependent oxidoreductase n=1 Tax=Anaerostipes sp. TaxID=1872530 RepID=UPI003FEF9D4D